MVVNQKISAKSASYTGQCQYSLTQLADSVVVFAHNIKHLGVRPCDPGTHQHADAGQTPTEHVSLAESTGYCVSARSGM